MDDRAVSTLIKACTAAVLVVAAALVGWDALRSVAALQDAQLALINTQRNLTDLTLDLFSASQRYPKCRRGTTGRKCRTFWPSGNRPKAQLGASWLRAQRRGSAEAEPRSRGVDRNLQGKEEV